MLKFEQVGVGSAMIHEAPFRAVEFEAGKGDLLVVVVRRAGVAEALADLALGLREPGGGRVLWQGRDWREMMPEEAEAERGRIGRVFEGWGWVSNLDVEENLKLAAHHHTRRDDDDLDRELTGWFRRFGVNEIPASRPAFTERRLLMIAQWVRAFVGQPAFLLLEHPERNARDEELDLLAEAVREARGRGCGILWFTNDIRVWQNRAFNPSAVWRREGERLVEVGKETHGGKAV